MPCKMADYAPVINTLDDLLFSDSEFSEYGRRIIEKLRAKDRPSINHAMAQSINLSPIAVSIEIKKAGIDEYGAEIQLGTWVASHFARLR